ncbi:hypothetical protein B0G93_11554 [Bacillus sp. V-88]|jgi:hypothetical protein|nr:hypothetical protein B0G93_11554 [Bacillus sp. V-88]SLK23723.1 hypothetical protein SAMN06295884_11554 [Bacillus sp. V-88]
MSLFKPQGPVNCGCDRVVCYDSCMDHPFVGDSKTKAYDCSTGADCYTSSWGECDCLL